MVCVKDIGLPVAAGCRPADEQRDQAARGFHRNKPAGDSVAEFGLRDLAIERANIASREPAAVLRGG